MKDVQIVDHRLMAENDRLQNALLAILDLSTTQDGAISMKRLARAALGGDPGMTRVTT